TPIAGRRHQDIKPIIGVFVNTLPLRNYPGGHKTIDEFLTETRQRTIEAYENQEYPFEELVEKADVQRDAGRNPIFDVMLTLGNFDDTQLEIPGLKLKPCEYETKVSKFDMTWNCLEGDAGLQLAVNYSTKLFKKETIRRFITYFERIAAAVLDEPGQKIAEIEILTTQERWQILYDFNDTAVGYPKVKTLRQLFEQQVEKSPTALAVIYENEQLTYAELNKRANALAEQLTAEGTKPNSIIALETERSLGMIIGIMAALKAGAAYMPIAPEYPGARKRYMIKDSGAKILIRKLSQVNQQEEVSAGCKIIDINAPGDTNSFNSPNSPNSFNSSDLAYLIYTSGTTGKPKGVAIENRNVVNLVEALEKGIYNYEEPVNISLVSPYIFDASVKQIFPALLLGHTLHVIPEQMRFDGYQLVVYYTGKKIHVADGTPFHLKLIMNAARELDADFPVRQFVIGGEVLERDLAAKIVNTVGRDDFRIVNVYGPTECSDVTSTYRIDRKTLPQKGKIPIGKPIANVKIYITGRYGNLQGIGVPGELCIGGSGLGRGYLNRPETTHERFVPNPFAKPAKKTFGKAIQTPATQVVHETPTAPQTLYKTGDIARWQPDGNIEFLGRLDHQVKIRGFRIELEEIESLLLEHQDINEAVILVKGDKKEDHYLCAYIASEKEITNPQIRDFLSRKLPHYMLPAHTVRIDTIPLTATGKIDRKALPEPEIIAADNFIAPRNRVEETLATLWTPLLGIEKKHIGIDDNFFHQGGHSLKAMMLIAKIHKALKVAVPLQEIFAKPTIRTLSAYIGTKVQDKFLSINAVEKKEHYPASSAQKRLHFIQQMEPENTGYNMPIFVKLEGQLNKTRLEETFLKLIQRHESFRTCFEVIEGEILQKVIQPHEVEFQIQYYEAGSEGPEDIIKRFVRCFTLSNAPLIRIGLINVKNTVVPTNILLVDTHHTIADGISRRILTGEFMNLYAGKELLPLKLHYKDYSEWQNQTKEKERAKKQETYWLKQFEGEIPVLNLPTDYPRPAIRTFEGKKLFFRLDEGETDALKSIALAHGATLYMVLLTLFNSFLSKLSGQEDIIIGTPTAGRGHVDLGDIIGMFVNTLGLRNQPHGDKTYEEFLDHVKETTLNAFDNQDYQFEELVETLDISRDASRNPLFDVMFLLQNMELTKIEIPGLKLKPF
ncbi:MAG: amino acid adenylation domain-containing protein, partial [bacterium]|nr:amino acid adenylation domain-containing protein [bacterium]